jgi:hypothetical protein
VGEEPLVDVVDTFLEEKSTRVMGSEHLMMCAVSSFCVPQLLYFFTWSGSGKNACT